MAIKNWMGALSSIALLAISVSATGGQEKQMPAGTGMDEGAPSEPKILRGPALASTAPNVTWIGHQLTISANNSTLGSVLAAVRKCTGAQIDIPDSASATMMFDQLGPGTARDVLNSLLSETGFDYVIGASDADPEKIETVLLMVRAKDAVDEAGGDRNLSPARRAYLHMLQNGRQAVPPPEENPQEPAGEPDPPATDQAAAPPTDTSGANGNQPASVDAASAAPAATSPLPGSSASTSTNSNQGPNQPGSTEERITNMQQLFEQRQQMMQTPPASPPQ
jgi:hypothetical protein